MPDAVIVERRGSVLLMTLNRPEARNVINSAIIEGLLAAVARLDSSDDLAVGVLAGAGRGFSAGMDLMDFVDGRIPRDFDTFVKDGCRKPLIAAIEGFAIAGGLELCLTADLIVASKGTKIGLPEVKVGLMAAGGGLIRLPRLLPPAVVMELVLTGEPMTAEDAFTHGLIARLVEKGQAVESALSLAEQISANAPLAVAASKKMVRNGGGRTESELWELQGSLTKEVFRSSDAKEGSRAFGEKRTPTWTGT